MVYRELITSYRREISQSQYDSPDTQLSQGTKPSEETAGNSTVSAVIENRETKHSMTLVANQLLPLIP